MRKDFLAFWLILFVQLSVLAQPSRPGSSGSAPLKSGIIQGVIQDSATHGIIEYATVGLFRIKDSVLVNGIVTGADGRFVFKGLPYGEYYLDVNFMGYSKKRISPLAITSEKASIDMGIVAQSQRVEYKIDKKVVNVSQDITGTGGTLVNVLENTPSVEVDVEGNVSLRGSSNFQLLIDGKPSIIGGSEGLQQIPASSVQNIEIITSPSAKYDPDGAAGIINVIMKKQKNNGIGGIVNTSIGTRNKYSTDLLLNFRRQKLNYFIGGEYSNRKHYNEGENERRTYLGDTTTYILTDNDRVLITR